MPINISITDDHPLVVSGLQTNFGTGSSYQCGGYLQFWNRLIGRIRTSSTRCDFNRSANARKTIWAGVDIKL